MNMKTTCAAIAAAFCAGSAFAEFSIVVDPKAKPIHDTRSSTCGPVVGYAGCAMQMGPGVSDSYFFDEVKYDTAKAMKESGAWFQRMWSANQWFAARNQKGKDGKPMSNPDAAFKFWKQNGFKILMTIECWCDANKQEIYDLANYIVSNKYQSCIAGFELGNETYFHKGYAKLAPRWAEVVRELVKIWPGVKLGINVAELFELNPDLTQVRSRMLAEGTIKRDTYFAAADFNRYSAQFIMAMSKEKVLDKITHVIWHAYGAESPYSCSYYGMKRFRGFAEAFPELKGKQLWLSEIRPRSDEDNNCQRYFRETLIMGHYAVMMLAQPDVDGYNHHQFWAIGGGVFQSDGRTYGDQWQDGSGFYPDFRSPFNRPRWDLNHLGVSYRIITEGMKQCPIVVAYGTSKDPAGKDENSFYTSAKFTDQVYARRRAIKEGKRGSAVPKVDGEVEWVVTTSGGMYCIIMVNSKQTAEKFTFTVKGRQLAAPNYRTLSCPEKFLDCRDIPGEGHPWKQLSWEDSQCGYTTIPMERYEGMKPKADVLELEIAPNTVQTVTIAVR